MASERVRAWIEFPVIGGGRVMVRKADILWIELAHDGVAIVGNKDGGWRVSEETWLLLRRSIDDPKSQW